MITKETAKRLKKSLISLLLVQPQLKQKESEYDALKKQIETELKAVSGEFDNGTLLVPGVAVIASKLNPPKLVWVKDGKSLTPAERETVSGDLHESFLFEDINTKMVLDAINRGDKVLAASLKKKGIACEQGSRFEIRKAV